MSRDWSNIATSIVSVFDELRGKLLLDYYLLDYYPYSHLNIYTIFSRTYNHITVRLELVLEIYHLLFVSGSALVNRVT